MKPYGVTGWKNSGKTGLVVRLVAHFTAAGLLVSTVKHAHHDSDIDQPGRDSHRHRLAGAQQVLVASPRRWALMTELRAAPEPPLADLLTHLDACDLVLIEGYKSAAHPKIEVQRVETAMPLMAPDNPTIRAVASNAANTTANTTAPGLPFFHLDDTAAIAAFIRHEVGL